MPGRRCSSSTTTRRSCALRNSLAAPGYTVLVAADGASALRAAADGHPDVVVLDLGLPDLDGTEVIEGLCGWSPVPILVLSARTDSPDKVRALDAGADDYVTKPFGMAELLARLRAAVRRVAVSSVDGEAWSRPRTSPSTWPRRPSRWPTVPRCT